MDANEGPDLLSPAWWDAAVEAWNASGHTAHLARFGTAVFRLSDAPAPGIWMHWDSHGRVERRPGGRRDDPDFSATRQDWIDFFAGRFGYGMGVLRFKIRFRGPVRRVLPYTRGINAFARVCRSLL
ncbi:hypothetical protein KF840_22005 [bacterium]|nr:hypothetical protein [bacterium]